MYTSMSIHFKYNACTRIFTHTHSLSLSHPLTHRRMCMQAYMYGCIHTHKGFRRGIGQERQAKAALSWDGCVPAFFLFLRTDNATRHHRQRVA